MPLRQRLRHDEPAARVYLHRLVDKCHGQPMGRIGALGFLHAIDLLHQLRDSLSPPRRIRRIGQD